MFQNKINIYKVIKMLAKIKYDEDQFKRPLDTSSSWYKLSRTKIDYRQISFDRMNRERPGLANQLNKKVPIFESIDQPNSNPLFKKTFGLDQNSKFFSGYYRVTNYEQLPINFYYDHSRAIKDLGADRFWEDDVIYAWRYDVYNFWWFDMCLIPERLFLAIGGSAGDALGYFGTESDDNNFAKYYEHSPSRDLATSTFLQFASMQDNSQAFIHKTSYITAPYMPYVEQQKVYLEPGSKTLFDDGNPIDYNGITATIYGIGNLFEVFKNKSKSSLDRINRQKMFNDFFKALDDAKWLDADKIADELIKLTDATGWAPYIGYGDLSLFIQRMNIPSEYIMTHALTEFQDEVLTNAYASIQINNKVSDSTQKMQINSGRFRSLETFDEIIATDSGYIPNDRISSLYDLDAKTTMRVRRAIANHTMTGGSIDDAYDILEKSDTLSTMVESLESKMLQIGINNELKNIDKAKNG